MAAAPGSSFEIAAPRSSWTDFEDAPTHRLHAVFHADPMRDRCGAATSTANA
jgi:hypothetical protein